MVAYTAIFRAVADYQSAIREGNRLAGSFGKVTREAGKVGPASRNLAADVIGHTARIARAMDRTGKAMSLGLTVPLAIGGGKALRTFADFELQIVSAGSKSAATKDQLERMKVAALDVGNTTKFSATEAAQGLDQLAAAGFNAEDAIKTLRPVTLAAQAANEDLALTALTVARAMNAFSIPADRAAHVADVFTQAVNTTALTMHDLQEALGQVGEIGPRFGQSLEDTVAAVGRLVDMGVPAASAGTAIRQAITFLSAPTQQAGKLMAALGLNLRTATGEMKPLPDLVAEVAKGVSAGNPQLDKYKGLVGLSAEALKEWAKENGYTNRQAQQLQRAMTQGGKAFQDYAFKTLFGVEGAKAFALAMSNGKPLIISTSKETKKLDDLTRGLTITMGEKAAKAFIAAHTAGDTFTATGADAIKAVSALGTASSGTAEQIGAMFKGTTAQKLDNMKGAFETLAVTLIEKVKPEIDNTITSITGMTIAVSDFNREHPKTARFGLALLGIVAGAGPAVFIVGKLVKAVGFMVLAFGKVKGAVGTARAVVSLYGEAALGAAKKQGVLRAGLNGVRALAGGPYVVAIGLAIGALIAIAAKHRAAVQASKDFANSLEFQNGMLDESSRNMLFHRLATEGVLKAVQKAGVSEDDYNVALLRGGVARQAMIDALDEIYAAQIRAVDAGEGDIVAHQEQADAARDASDALKREGRALDEAADAAGAGAVAAQRAADENYRLGTASGEVKGKAQQAADAQRDMADASQQLGSKTLKLNGLLRKAIDNFTILRQGAADSADAELNFNESIVTMSKSVEKGQTSLSKHTEAGIRNRRTILASIKALNDSVTANFKNNEAQYGATKAAKIARAETDKGREAMVKAAIKAGFNAEEVRKMQKQYLKTPKAIETQVRTKEMKKVLGEIATLKRKIKELEGKLLKVGVQVDFKENKLAKSIRKTYGLGAKIPGVARGGKIPGYTPVRQGDDLILKMRRGEGVYVSEAMRDPYEVERMRKVNQAALSGQSLKPFQDPHVDATHGLAGGGLVGAPKRLNVDVDSRATHMPGGMNFNKGYTSAAAKMLDKLATYEANTVADRMVKTLNSMSMPGSELPPLYGVTGGRDLVRVANGYMSKLFLAAMHKAEVQAQRKFHIYQAGWRNGATKLSGTTHDGDAVDARQDGTLLASFRRNVGAMWMRNWPGNYHMHGVPAPGRGYGSASARAQYRDYLRGGDGLGGSSGVGAFPMSGIGRALGGLVDDKLGKRLAALGGYADGTRSAAGHLKMVGENGAELQRLGPGSHLLNSKATLDYLSQIESLAANAPTSLARLASAPVPSVAAPNPTPDHVEINMPIYYPQADRLPTMAAQMQLVRAGRSLAGRRLNGG